MIVSIGLCVGVWWSSLVGELYVGDQGQAFDDQQQAQESFDQGKYNWRSSLLPINH